MLRSLQLVLLLAVGSQAKRIQKTATAVAVESESMAAEPNRACRMLMHEQSKDPMFYFGMDDMDFSHPKKAYRKFAMKCHPDKLGGVSEPFKAANTAYEFVEKMFQDGVKNPCAQHDNYAHDEDMMCEEAQRALKTFNEGERAGLEAAGIAVPAECESLLAAIVYCADAPKKPEVPKPADYTPPEPDREWAQDQKEAPKKAGAPKARHETEEPETSWDEAYNSEATVESCTDMTFATDVEQKCHGGCPIACEGAGLDECVRWLGKDCNDLYTMSDHMSADEFESMYPCCASVVYANSLYVADDGKTMLHDDAGTTDNCWSYIMSPGTNTTGYHGDITWCEKGLCSTAKGKWACQYTFGR